MKHISHTLRTSILVLSLSVIYSCSAGPAAEGHRNLDFNDAWLFQMGEPANAHLPDCPDGAWERVHLPHDWGIKDFTREDSIHKGPFFKGRTLGADIGYLRTGTAWYRKHYVTPENLGEKQVLLHFDGVQTQMELWVNGRLMGSHVYGYSPFHLDITPALNAPGTENVIAVKTVNTGENSRWYAGSGLYRPVRISMLDPLSILPWGVFIHTPVVQKEGADVHVEVRVLNRRSETVTGRINVTLRSPEGKEILMESGAVDLGAGQTYDFRLEGKVPQPLLWSPESPELYQGLVEVMAGDQLTDAYHCKFGIRSISYSAEEGMLLNGEKILMKGACLHSDHGLLGAAAFPDAEYRRVKLFLDKGYNAIRCSHNPPSESFLDACDELGMLVIDEAFDHWELPKRPGDYSNYFREWHRQDVRAMVLRDRMHPSVIMWSIGNEVQERARPGGLAIAADLVAAIRELDDTRLTTQAICSFWDNPGMEWDESAPAFEVVDMGGYNYTMEMIEPDHVKHPRRISYGSESFPVKAWEKWELVKKHPFFIGDFVWTGMDYIGESGIGHTYFSDAKKPITTFHKAWPWYVSWCGDLDLLGDPKPQSLYRDVVWGESQLALLVRSPVPEGKIPQVSYWGWPDEVPSWNWEGHEGKEMEIMIYSTCPEVALFLNGEEVGRKKLDLEKGISTSFSLPYESGELEAKAYREGRLVAEKSLVTAGAISSIQMVADQEKLHAHPNALLFVKVEAQDGNGLRHPHNREKLIVQVEGPVRLQAAGNGSPIIEGSFTDDIFSLFRGRGMVILRSTGEEGSISLKVSSESGITQELAIQAI